jgi:hypothetical protein
MINGRGNGTGQVARAREALGVEAGIVKQETEVGGGGALLTIRCRLDIWIRRTWLETGGALLTIRYR